MENQINISAKDSSVSIEGILSGIGYSLLFFIANILITVFLTSVIAMLTGGGIGTPDSTHSSLGPLFYRVFNWVILIVFLLLIGIPFLKSKSKSCKIGFAIGSVIALTILVTYNLL